MAFKLTNDILDYINNFVDSFNKELVPALATNAGVHFSCNGCSGDCNMTCKGGCGSRYGD